MLKSRILVVIDMQNDFLTGPLGCMEPERALFEKNVPMSMRTMSVLWMWVNMDTLKA